MRFSQARVLVDDFGACFRFYRDILGLTPTFGDETSGYADFAAGGATIALFERPEQAEAVALRPAGDGALLGLAVHDVGGAVEALRARGASFEGEPVDRADWGIRVAYLRDPAGTLIELHQSIPAAG